MLTIWPEPNSTYFWDDYVKHFDGDTIIIVGTPGVTGKEEMFDWLSEAYEPDFTTVCKINLGCIFDFEAVHVWRKKKKVQPSPSKDDKAFDLTAFLDAFEPPAKVGRKKHKVGKQKPRK